jgi:hypothetical protein
MLDAEGNKVPNPECYQIPSLFYGDELDGRKEKGRAEREAVATSICWRCPYRVLCLHRSFINKEYYGVHGAMSEGERREFDQFMKEEGYEEPPSYQEADEFLALLNSYYRRKAECDEEQS